MRKIRRGDEVVVICGKNKGQRGNVRINLIEEDRVVVEGVNIVIKHIKRGRARQAGSGRGRSAAARLEGDAGLPELQAADPRRRARRSRRQECALLQKV